MTGNTEELIELTGGCGAFQVLHVLSTHVCRVVSIWGLNFMTFGNYDPGRSLTNGSLDDALQNVSSSNFTYSFINVLTSSSKDGHSVSLNSSQGSVCSNNAVFDHIGETPVSQWNLVCESAWVNALITAIQMLGQLAGSAIGGYFGENFGRRVCLYSYVLLFMLANLLAVFSTSWQMFSVFRFFVGMGTGGIIPTAFIYTMEFLTPKWRGIVGGLPVINVGLFVFSVIVYYERDWKLVHITIAACSFLALMTFFWASESMRWLAVHGKNEKAKEIVCKIAKYNKAAIPKMDAIDITSQSANSTSTESNDNNKVYSYIDLFRDRKNRIINIKLLFLWFFEVIAFFSLMFSVGALPGDFYINFIIFSSSEIPAVIFTSIIVNKIGRTKAGAGYFGIAGLACLIAFVLSLANISTKSGIALVLLTMTAKGLLAGGRAIIKICTSELIPTNTRNLGFSFHIIVSRIGAIIAPFLVPGVLFSLNVELIMLSTFLIISAGIFLSLPETNDKAMADLEMEIDVGKREATNNYSVDDATNTSQPNSSSNNLYQNNGLTSCDNAQCNPPCKSEKDKIVLPLHTKRYVQ